MNEQRKIVWLASYPKSGNTWFRIFLTNLLNHTNEPANINNLYPSTIASSRSLLDEATGLESSNLTLDEIELLRPQVYRYVAETSSEILYHKIHDAWISLPDGNTLVPEEVTKAVLYFIRNPLDVAISFAHHSATTIDKAIEMMNNSQYAFCGRETKLHNQTRQRLLSWSEHVASWIDQSGLPLLVMRYEDILTDTFAVFKDALKFCGIEATDEKICKSIEFSSFENIKKQEQEKGFREKAAKSESFFRKGISGDWKYVLTKEQIDKIVSRHKKMMERFGYWSCG
ncbi:MAG TPA: sulfotransferase domain-containing protein [Bacteroidales bacterium]|nr:sulfotransferase domain-containing protein [Bacteroidales bacterium]